MKATTNITLVDPVRPDPKAIRRAVDRVRQGGVVIFPTLGIYGLGADPLNAHAVGRIFAIKGRDPSKPLLVLIDHPCELAHIALPVNPLARRLMERFWPGRVTFVVRARPDLPPGLTAGTGKIGVRQAAHPVAAALARTLGRPLIGTSANLSGGPGCAAVADLHPDLVGAVDLVLDAGPLSGDASTVVDVSENVPVVLRQGAVPAAAIHQAMVP